MFIREALDSDLDVVLSVERAAFGSDEEASLVKDLMGDKSAKPIPEENADAWMLLELHPGAARTVGGKVVCADKLNRPEYWRE